MSDNESPDGALAAADGATTPNTTVQDTDTSGLEAKSEADKLKRESQRLRNERNKAREEAETLKNMLSELNTAKEKAMSDEVQKTISMLQAERDQLVAQVSKMKDLQSLTGKVADPEAALKLLEDGHRGSDGEILVDKLLERYGFLTPQGQSNPPGGGGATAINGELDIDKALRSGDPDAINAAFNQALKRK